MFSSVVGQLQRTVGQNIRAYREARGVSQEEFAADIGLHRTYMGGVERGERNLTLKSLEKLAERIGIDPLELLQPTFDAALGEDPMTAGPQP